MNPSSPTTRAMLEFAADWPLAKKVTTIQSFLGNDYFHANGIMYCMWHCNDHELRPYRPEDFAGQQPFEKPTFTAIGHMENENSTYTSGVFLWSQCLRYQATRDPEALEFAARAFRSIDLIFQLTESTPDIGFLCKPYDWKVSHESSPDQQYTVIMGLWLYRDLCDAATKQRIDFILVSIAKWWLSREYKLVFFGKGGGSWLANTAQYGPMFALMMHLAWRVSQDKRWLDECRRILELCGPWRLVYDEIRRLRRNNQDAWSWPPHLYGCEYDPARRPHLMADWETRAPMWFVAGPAEYFLQTDLVNHHVLRHVLGRVYRYQQFGLREDLLQLYIEQVDLERDLWRPLVCPRSEATIKANPFGMHFMTYWSEVCMGDAALRLIDSCLIAHQHAYEFSPGALTLAKRLFARLDAERLRWFIDPDGKQLLPPDRFMKYSLSSETALALIAYWRARLHKIPLE